jgi:hypothetical protein
MSLFMTLYLLIGVISSFFLAGRACKAGWGSVTNFLLDTPFVSKIGMAVIMFVNVFAWPITALYFLKNV